MEHFFGNIEGWFDYEDLYREIVANASTGSRFVEVGAWKGRSAAFLGVEIVNSGKHISLDVVDHFIGVEGVTGDSVQMARFVKSYKECRRNLEPLEFINIVPLRSQYAAALYEDNSLDFVFIDANHAYPFVKQDIEAWYPKVKRGGLLAGHDYTSHKGVKKAVDEKFPGAKQVSLKCWITTKP